MLSLSKQRSGSSSDRAEATSFIGGFGSCLAQPPGLRMRYLFFYDWVAELHAEFVEAKVRYFF